MPVSTKKKPRKKEPDVRPDAWERFERAVDVAVATKPIHRPAKKLRRSR